MKNEKLKKIGFEIIDILKDNYLTYNESLELIHMLEKSIHNIVIGDFVKLMLPLINDLTK